MKDHKKPDLKKVIKRSVFAFFFILVGFLFIAARVVIIQAVNPDYFIEKAEYNLTQKLFLPAKRGDIEDRSGEKLAITIPLKKICCNPYYLKDKENVARVLKKYLHLSDSKIWEKLDSGNRYVVIAEKLPVDVAEKIRLEAKENMLWIEDDFLRVYPNGNLASHVLGFVVPSVVDGVFQYDGKEGAEYYYNDLLRGKPGYVKAQFYSSVGAIVPQTIREKIEPKDGKNLILTIDKDLQYFVENALQEQVKSQEARAGSAIVIDSKTGEVLAMASYPSFNPNEYYKVDDESCYINRCYRAVYEPGSTFKTITIAAALNEGLIHPDKVFYLPEKLKIGKYTIREAHHRPEGSYTVRKILQESMNIGAVRIAELLGPEKFYEYASCFGFGRKTGLDLNGEQKGKLLPPEEWKKTTLATMSFGQGISCTPLQILMATNVFANNGYYIKPHLFKASYDEETGSVQEWIPEKPIKIISEKTAETMKKMLVEVVEKGTGKLASVPGFTVAGKTGTAQVPGKKGYEKGKYVSSFVGFLPADNPKFSIIVVIYEPKKEHYGGVVAAPVFAKIAEFAVKHFNVPPDKPLEKDAGNDFSTGVTGD